jgi:hypothetical protein
LLILFGGGSGLGALLDAGNDLPCTTLTISGDPVARADHGSRPRRARPDRDARQRPCAVGNLENPLLSHGHPTLGPIADNHMVMEPDIEQGGGGFHLLGEANILT